MAGVPLETQVFAPSNAAVVQVVLEGDNGVTLYSNAVPFTYTMKLESAIPAASAPGGGGQITLGGVGFGCVRGVVLFEPADGVGVNSVARQTSSWSDTRIVAQIPKESSWIRQDGGHATIVVHAGGADSKPLPFTYR